MLVAIDAPLRQYKARRRKHTQYVTEAQRRRPGCGGAVTRGYDRLAVASISRCGQVAHASDSPAGPVTSGPPQEPRRQRPSSMTPTAMIAMTIAIPPRVSKNRAISHLFYCPWPHAGPVVEKETGPLSNNC